MANFYIKIYDHHHNQLDEMHHISNVIYTNSQNAKGMCTFNIPLSSSKTTLNNFTSGNHIELYEGSDNNCVWWGVFEDKSYNAVSIQVVCYGYLYLLENRRMKNKTYKNMTYGDLLFGMLMDVNDIYETGITKGTLNGACGKTERITTDEDYCLERMIEYVNEMGYSIEINKDRELNFYESPGEYKRDYLLCWNNEYCNITKQPTLNVDGSEVINYIHGRTSFTPDKETIVTETITFTTANEEVVLNSIAFDEDSISQYGLKEEFIKMDNLRLQETLDERVVAELEKKKQPAVSIDMEIRNSFLCPMKNIKVGDQVMIELPFYHNFRQVIRILQIERNCTKNVYNLVVGNMILTPAAPSKKQFA